MRKVVSYVNEKDPDQGTFNADVVQALKELQSNPLAGGHILADVEVSASVVLVPHLLGRIPKGWIEIAVNANRRIINDQAPDRDFLYLISTGDVTCSIYVF